MIDFEQIHNIEEVETGVYKNINQDFINQVSGENRFLNIIHLNIRSLHKNFEELLIYLQKIGTENLDIVVLSETWNLEEVRDYYIPNFTLYYNNSKYNQNDGVVVYVKNVLNITMDIIKLSHTNVIRITFKVNDISYGLTASYRPPAINVNTYLDQLEAYFSDIVNLDVEFFIGDINLNIKNKTDANVNTYLCMLSARGFVSYINKPTRVTENYMSIIDHIFVRQNVRVKQKVNLSSFVIEIELTDHYATFLSLNIQQRTHLNSSCAQKVKIINYNRLNKSLNNVKWDDVLQTNNAQEGYDIFLERFLSNVKANTENKIITHKNRKLKPWITQGLINSIQHRDYLKRKLKNQYTEENIREYKIYRNFLNNLIRTTKNTFYWNKLNSTQNNYRKVWQVINEVSNNSAKKENYNITDQQGNLIDNDTSKANFFNNFFANIGNKMASSIDNAVNAPPQEINNKIVNYSLFLQPVTEGELIIIISNLKNNTAAGPDGMSVTLLKKCHKYIITPLTHIINTSFLTGKLPKQWKESVTTPIYKSGNRQDTTNYRPISVISNFAKLFEQCVKKRLICFLEKHNILNKNQFGFRKSLSTEDAILELINSIAQVINVNKKCICIFLDLAKAFDTVNHALLLNRLEDVGVRGSTLELFKNYLEERYQVVKINSAISNPLPVTMGVPQGTVLGPILFLIYINQLGKLDINGKCISYADDTVLVFEADSWSNAYNKAEIGLQYIQNWLNMSLLSLNVTKTKYLTFSLTVTDQPSISELYIHKNCPKLNNCGCPSISKTNCIKYLGVWVDQYLRWNEHTEHLSKRLRGLIYKFYQLRDILDNKNLIMVYGSLAESLIKYCITVWGGLYKNSLHNLQVIQNYILKIIFKKQRSYPTKMLYEETGLFNIKGIYAYQCALWVYKNDLLSVTSTSYQTRSAQRQSVQVPLVKKSHIQRFVFFYGPKIYNLLPPEIKNIKNSNAFKKQLKLFISANFDTIKTIFSA